MIVTLVVPRTHPYGGALVSSTLTDITDVPAEDDAARRRRLRTVVAASLLGTTIEWYDFFLYATAASLVFSKVFFPDQSSFVGTLLSFATFAVGFVVRPIGGVVFGHIGDRIGRKRTLAVTMVLMGAATALMGVLPTAAQIGFLAPVLLLCLRILQGFALGGEWAGAVLLAVEHSPARRRGLFGSIPQIGLALGLALGTGVFAILQVAFDDHDFLVYGWRIAFLLSIVLVVIGFVVRLKVSETPAFREVAELEQKSSAPLRGVVLPPNTRNTVLGLLARWGEGSAFNTWGVFAIAYATGSLGLPRVPVLVSVTIAALVMAVGLPMSGVLTDRYGPRRIYLIGMIAYAVAVYPVFALFGTEKLVWFTVGLVIVFGVVHALFYGAQGTLFASLYPTPVRYTGLSVVYQFSGIYASGLTPLILTALIGASGGSPWWAAGYLVATGLISVAATAAIRQRDLHL
ncbi:putative major facilitator superfamily transporter [Gordonia polyisoprenivorans NBRC 16320 = JCM 10675]|uniref:Putative proline/betaine transporter n=1 Tax=Gordonia polyisoprenivorans TaxID=84595 RepID=A0A846WWZ0_9ACTN|nr:MHS family MFS transporter [Gordonia polyisoprenivorans]GAB22069.1 putative major facilitator superfamily transporter [Gordonia polyisoprenivorans NBRC 16320 = JCM 10675]